VSRVRTPNEPPVVHNRHGTPVDANLPALERYARTIMRNAPVQLTFDDAAVLVTQLRETAFVRGWRLRSVAIMPDHVHLVVEAPEAVDAGKLMGDFKAYATRALDRRHGAKRRWWSERGSTRLKLNEAAIVAAIDYDTRQQPNPLAVWALDALPAS
jgi:REP element-mobilizing transposase RayT